MNFENYVFLCVCTCRNCIKMINVYIFKVPDSDTTDL